MFPTPTNHAPTVASAIADQSVTTGSHFNLTVPANTFNDADGDSLTYTAKLADGSALPSWLTFDAVNRIFSGTPPSNATTIDVSLKATDTHSASATDTFRITIIGGNELLTGTAGNDTLDGGAGNDTINALAGNDVVIGGTGNDVLDGGEGSDIYLIAATGDHVQAEIQDSGVSGTDEVRFGSTVAGATLTLYAGDTGIESVVIGTGNAAAAVTTGTTALNVDASAVLNGLAITGNAGNNSLTGTGLGDTIDGGLGNDTLTGGLGADSLAGGNGSDTYVVDDAGDQVAETNAVLATGGNDTVQSSVDYSLGANLENLTLTGSATSGTGNTLANLITGNAGNNTLDGGIGKDTLVGGTGDDTFILDLMTTGAGAAAVASLQDSVTEASSAGTDTLQLRGSSSNSKATTLTLATNLENLDASTTGSSKLNLTGNTVANTLTGNAANNLLNGGADADTLAGGLGDDTYVIDNAGDSVTEGTDAGTDLVMVNIATANGTYTLADNVEKASIISTLAYNLTGNDLANTLTGNAAANTLDGGLGADSMAGGNGNDTYVVDNIGDKITEASVALSGKDTVQSGIDYSLGANLENLTLTGSAASGTGNTLANLITGNAGNNTLDGGLGNDTLDGGAGADILLGGKGNDTYVVDDAGDIITEQAAQGVDTILSGINYSLADTDGAGSLGGNVENLTLTGTALNATGNALANKLTGNDGNNALDGGAGKDTLAGGAGDDSYTVDLTAAGGIQDTIIEALGAGTDTVQLRVTTPTTNAVATTLTLAVNVENLDASATGSSKINLTGNTLDNILTGNDAANTLSGGVGNDSLVGGLGNDVLIGGLGNDSLSGGDGQDVFLFNTLPNASTNVDTISDFNAADDTIKLENTGIFTKLTKLGVLDAGAFVSEAGATAHDANDRILYDTDNGKLYYDADGSGLGAAVQFATLAGSPALTNADFVVI